MMVTWTASVLRHRNGGALRLIGAMNGAPLAKKIAEHSDYYVAEQYFVLVEIVVWAVLVERERVLAEATLSWWWCVGAVYF